MQKLWTTFVKDVKLSYNGLYFYIEIGMAVIFLLIMLFVVPENFDRTQTFYGFIEDASIEEQLTSTLLEDGNTDVQLFESRKDLEAALADNRSAIGVHIYERDGRLTYEMVLQGYENDSMKAMIQSSIEGAFMSKLPGYIDYTSVTSLEAEPSILSDREMVLPVYLVLNVAFMGLFVIAAYVFLDKEEGVIKAFAVAPVGVWHYLASKILIMALMGLITSLVVMIALVGFKVNYLLFIGLILSFNVFGSTLGLLITSFFESMTKAMGAMFSSIFILMFASISYFAPAFTPAWIKWLPSYPMIFSFRELLLENGDTLYIIQNIGVFFGLSALLFAYTNLRFKKTLTV
jgi:ABC-type multidrug transport system permease subunit